MARRDAMRANQEGPAFIGRCRKQLDSAWATVLQLAEQGPLPTFLDDESLRRAINRALRSRTKTYHYVLPTQLVAKLARRSLDSRCLQAGRGGKGAFDARSVCQDVIVPFDRANHSVLGGSAEPYVSNPLRVPEVSERFIAQQKDKKGWQALCDVLDSVEGRHNAQFTRATLLQVLAEIHDLLQEVAVVYPVPKRVSLERCVSLIEQFIAARSGGDRPLALAAALFGTIGARFGLFHEVRRRRINAADAPSGQVADIECLGNEGQVVFAVEVKDQELTVKHVSDKLPRMRERGVSEFFFLVRKGVAPSDQAGAQEMLEKEFGAGHNLYVFDLATFSRGALALLGEAGRRDFLRGVGEQLDGYGSILRDRQAWATLMSSS